MFKELLLAPKQGDTEMLLGAAATGAAIDIEALSALVYGEQEVGAAPTEFTSSLADTPEFSSALTTAPEFSSSIAPAPEFASSIAA